MSDRCNHGVWLGDLCYACERERNLAAEIDRLAVLRLGSYLGYGCYE